MVETEYQIQDFKSIEKALILDDRRVGSRTNNVQPSHTTWCYSSSTPTIEDATTEDMVR
eukprot:Gb_16384 [translate_table: standard]